MAGYVGNIPVPQSTQTRQTFTATASQTSFPTIGYTAGFIDVYLNGIKLLDTVDYAATNGSDVVLTTGAALNDILEVTIFDTFTTSSATFSGTTTFADGGNIITATAGTDNVRLGENAGNSIASGGNNNVTIGKDAGTALTTGDNNVAVGFEALKTEDANGNSTAIGYRALKTQNAGAEAYNVAVGVDAGTAITTATRNTVVGSSAGSSNQTSLYNTYVGYGAGQSTTGQGNTFIGDVSGYDVVAGEFNTLLGQQSGNAITSGDKNTVIGRFNGNQNSVDIRTSSNNIVLSDGDGNNRLHHNGSYLFAGNLTAASYWPSVGTSSGQNAFSVHATNGAVGVTSNDVPLYLNKNNGDGILLYLYSEGSAEGSISVSGSTVSYQGGHLSRWSQLSDGSKDSSLVKGTVMTNLDKMCVWEVAAVAEGDTIKSASGDERIATADDVADAYTENNEQLNCMAVSSVEGDPNVAGVFVNWDFTDDGYNDLNVAMTGDMVIRIAKGVTVARGDLLMSAGDGTAKPQDDDIVRSKTIAKVTSTNVSHTYDDESYLVPCVLMA